MLPEHFHTRLRLRIICQSAIPCVGYTHPSCSHVVVDPDDHFDLDLLPASEGAKNFPLAVGGGVSLPPLKRREYVYMHGADREETYVDAAEDSRMYGMHTRG